MKIFMKYVIPGKIRIQLIVDYSFQDFTNGRQNSYWSLIFSFKLGFLLMKRHPFTKLPTVRKPTLHDRLKTTRAADASSPDFDKYEAFDLASSRSLINLRVSLVTHGLKFFRC